MLAGKIFPDNKYIRAAAATVIATTPRIPDRVGLAVIEDELRHDPFAFDLLMAAGQYHAALGDADEAASILHTYAIRSPRSEFARRLAAAVGALPQNSP